MKLYLDATSKQNIGYTADWIRFEDDQYELTFDIQGWDEYSNTTLSCKIKGELIPWVLRDSVNDTECDLSTDSKRNNAIIDILFSSENIIRIAKSATHITVGIYPQTESQIEDTFTDCRGTLQCMDELIDFTFDIEINE